MTKKERAQMIVERLEQVYPEGICSLDYKKPHELMIAGRLSAQCTDARVNIVTKELFAKYKTIEDFANADVADIEEIIRLHLSICRQRQMCIRDRYKDMRQTWAYKK